MPFVHHRLKWIGKLSNHSFRNKIEMHPQGWDPEENPLSLRQFVYKASNKK